ncbi:Methyltransferase domain-containing protein [Lentzea xinjiangensis]|uniref:Methyltransferase domain-containing protein n=1 Tax=Lentzea xinjiangensis TaxID=402600 RepID=A0A1H9RHQ8_9PSEU|nr:class I SAM-dependent methyltransferase [Lentzea xinjiangensis]SER72286.1 Methyltransferase domain-containing protein [Lentzea xinjiangensis]
MRLCTGSATDGSPIAPDGSPVGLYRMLPPGREPEIITAVSPPGACVLELGCGAGRITHALVAAGHPVVAVDQSADMLEHVRDARTVLSDIESLDLGERFPVVTLGSCLVNMPELGEAFLDTCRRHVDDDGIVLVQRTSPQWARSLRAGTRLRVGPFDVLITEARVEDGLLTATQECTDGTTTWTHSWTDIVFEDGEFEELVTGRGFSSPRWTAEEWALLRPSPR